MDHDICGRRLIMVDLLYGCLSIFMWMDVFPYIPSEGFTASALRGDEMR